MKKLSYTYLLLNSLDDITNSDYNLRKFTAKVSFIKLGYYSYNSNTVNAIERSVDLLMNASEFDTFHDLLIFALKNYKDEWHEALVLILSSIKRYDDDEIRNNIIQIVEIRNYCNIELQKLLTIAYLGNDKYKYKQPNQNCIIEFEYIPSILHNYYLDGLIEPQYFMLECIRLIKHHKQNFILIQTIFECYSSFIKRLYYQQLNHNEMLCFIQNYRYRFNQQLNPIILHIEEILLEIENRGN